MVLKIFFFDSLGSNCYSKVVSDFSSDQNSKSYFLRKNETSHKNDKNRVLNSAPPRKVPPLRINLSVFFVGRHDFGLGAPPQQKGYLKTIQSCPVLNFQPNRSNIEEVRAISISKKCWSTRSTFRGKNRAFKSKYRYYRQRVRAARISILSFCMEKMHKVPMIILVKFGPPGTTILGVMKDLVWSFFSLFSIYLIFLLFFFRRKNALSKEWPISRVGFFGQKNDPTWWSNFSKNPASIFLKIDQGVPRNHMKA